MTLKKYHERRDLGICTICGKVVALERAEKYRYRVSGDKTPMPVPEEYAGECIRCTLPAVKDGLCARHLKIRERSVMR